MYLYQAESHLKHSHFFFFLTGLAEEYNLDGDRAKRGIEDFLTNVGLQMPALMLIKLRNLLELLQVQ